MRYVKNILLLLASAFFFASCAKVPVETPPELYWPFPPEKPVVKFVDLVMGSIDVTGVRSGKFKQLFFGEEQEVTFIKPSFVTVRDEVMYVTDVKFIHVYDFGKGKFRVAGLGVFGNITGIAVTPDGRIFAGDSGKKKVIVIDPKTGDWHTLEDAGYKFDTPGGMAVDDINKRLLIADSKNHSISVWGFDEKFLFSIGKRGKEAGEFNFPYDVAVDKEGRVHVVDSGNFRVQVLDRDGAFIRQFGSVGSTGGQFARPKGIALDSDGNIYVIDAAFGNFQLFLPEGLMFLAVGTNGAEPGKFLLPLGIHIDEKDKIYVVDQINKRVQLFQYIKESLPAFNSPAP